MGTRGGWQLATGYEMFGCRCSLYLKSFGSGISDDFVENCP